ncbi:MAG TPA: FixH family protein [Gemmatimonadales bacterium]|nr:FixH family protein [Gemmatimonadales bacterium]
MWIHLLLVLATVAWHPREARYARLADIPSHHGRYRATLTFAPDVAPDGAQGVVRVVTADGRPVPGARLVFEASMPEDSTARRVTPTMTRELGRGHYAVRGVRLDREGWWAVRATIIAPSGTDSLAFLVVR